MKFFRRFLQKADAEVQATGIVPADPATLGFGVGDIVKDTFRNEQVVTAIDPKALGGLGTITTRRLSDGFVVETAMKAHDLKFVRKAGNDEG